MWVWALKAPSTGQTSRAGQNAGTATTATLKAKWLAIIAGQVGWTVDHALLYLKGGGAAIREDHSLSPMTQTTNGVLICRGHLHRLVNSETRWGWLFGDEVTYAFTSSWSAFLEYNYMDFGKRPVDFSGIATGGPAFTNTIDIAQMIQVIKTGINYRFDWFAPVVAGYRARLSSARRLIGRVVGIKAGWQRLSP